MSPARHVPRTTRQLLYLLLVCLTLCTPLLALPVVPLGLRATQPHPPSAATLSPATSLSRSTPLTATSTSNSPILAPSVHAAILDAVRSNITVSASAMPSPARAVIRSMRTALAGLLNTGNKSLTSNSHLPVANSPVPFVVRPQLADESHNQQTGFQPTSAPSTTPLSSTSSSVTPAFSTITTPPPSPEFFPTVEDAKAAPPPPAAGPRVEAEVRTVNTNATKTGGGLGAKVSSWMGEVSSALGALGDRMRHHITPAANRYRVQVANDSLLVARVLGRMYRNTGHTGTVQPDRCVFHANKLTVEIQEKVLGASATPTPRGDGIGSEYRFDLPKHDVLVEEVTLAVAKESGAIVGYDIVVPLVLHSETPAAVVPAEMRKVNNDRNIQNASLAITAHDEEDSTDFLAAQLRCQRQHGNAGLARMLCTCRTMHTDSVTRRLFCISRVADKVVAAARTVGAKRVAHEVYHGAVMCKRGQTWLSATERCLTALLDRVAGTKSEFHTKHGRSILETAKEADAETGALIEHVLNAQPMAVDDLLGARETVDMDEDDDEDDESATKWSAWVVLIRVVMGVAYALGVLLLTVCVIDLSRQIRRHRAKTRRESERSRMTDTAQKLYATATAC